jgi:hypothetical protein
MLRSKADIKPKGAETMTTSELPVHGERGPLPETQEQVFALRQLGTLCRVELGAAETYELALGSTSLHPFHEVLQRNRASHAARAATLAARIQALGGEAPESAGAWAAVLALLQGPALGLSDKVALRVLRAGEERVLEHYRVDGEGVDVESQRMLLAAVMPAPVESCRAVVELAAVVDSLSPPPVV